MYPLSNSSNTPVNTFHHTDGKSLALVPELDKWNNEWRGVFRFGAVDCDEY